MNKETRGGPGRGQGRKPLKAGDPTVTVLIKMPTSTRENLKVLGGSAWVRAQIESASPHHALAP